MFHATIIFKKDVFHKIGFYEPRFKGREDLELWRKAAGICIFGNIQEILYIYNKDDSNL